MRKILLLIFFIFIVIIVNNENVLAQNSPVISYSTPQVYTVGSAITPLLPTNTGGAVYPANYSTPVNFVPYTTPFSIAMDGSDNVYTTNNSTGDLTKYNSAGTVLFTVNTGSIQASEIAVDGLGNIYVSQFTTSSVLKYNAAGTLLATITGFTDPYGIAIDASNNAYIADYFTGDIFEIVAGATTASIYLTGFTKPYGIIIDASGNMFVSEQGPGDIIKIAAGTLTRTTFASGFNGPRHLNKDLFGNIYVADYGNNAIKKISPAGVITSVLSAGLSSPRQVAFDSSGNLFAANYGANTLIKALATVYSINAPLPAGLNFDTTTGQISGTPATAIAATTFTITAYNASGTGSTPLTITVGAVKTAQQPPSVNTLTPSAVATTTATLNGFSNYTGSSTLVSFIYGTNPNLINGTTTLATTNSSINAANNNNSTLALTGLIPLTTYYYRVSSTNASGTTTGNILSFVTLPSSNANLSSLSLSNGTLSPVFASGTTSYTASVNAASVTITPVTSDPNATLTVNGTTLASGATSAAIALNVGTNTVTAVVTAQDGTTTQSYTITVNRAASSNAGLSSLSVSNGTLSPVFASGTTSYTASVNAASVTITPVTSDPNATLTVNGTTLASGATSAAIALNVGNNPVTAVVTAQDGTTTQSYTITVNRAASSNAGLSSLAISSGTLSPVFASGTTSYTASVGNTTNSLTITPATSDPNATLTVNGTTLASGNTSAPVVLNVGNNTITAVVTAQDGTTTQSYTITVNRAASSNASLSSLSVSNGTLSPVFASGTTSYTASVNAASVTITPVTSDPNATLTVNGTTLASGNTSAPVVLNVGNNTITAVVTAQDGTTTQSYTITVNRAASSNANLSSLSLSNGTLSPVFASGTTSYTASVNAASVTITPVTSDPNATLTVNGTTLASGATSAAIALNVGNNTVTAVVTAQDGTTTQSYTITVNRAASSNAGLSSLSVSNGTLSPVFASGTTSYTASVNAASVTITPVTSDPNATLTVNGTTLASGATSAAIALNVGNNPVTAVVTAQDGTTTQSYTITVNRAASSNAGLSSLAISSGTLSPVFASGTTSYTASVGNTTNSLTITPATSDPNATLTVNGTTLASGNTSAPVVLNVGNNTITAVVTAQDGTTTQSYTITVNRAASSNASLSSLSVSNGTLSPVFASGTTSYTASVNAASVTITPVTSDPNATLTVNGTTLASGNTSAPVVLNVGNNTITAVVTAQDGTTTQSYTITVNRAASSNANLSSLSLSNGTLSPVFASGTTSYTASVNAASVTITPVTSDPNATLTVNGTTFASGATSAAIALNVGTNTVTAVVTAQDGTTTQSYTITVNRAASSNAGLSSLAISNGTLSPVFASGTTSYTASVNAASVTITPVTSDPNATLTVNGTTLASGAISAAIALNVGNNTVTTVVTAQDGTTTQSYTITVNRAASSNAGLSSLSVSNGTLSPVFASGTTSYTASVNAASVTITPVTSDPNATLTVNGTTLASGATSAAIALNAGSSTITTLVTAPDGTTIQAYTVLVTRTITSVVSSNASLSNLSVSSGTLSPVFASGTGSYTASVSNATASVTITPATAGPNTTVTVNGTKITDGSPSNPVALNVGNNTITTVVTAQDGTTTQSYTITVNRAASSNATLSNLAISSGKLGPAFATGITSYTASVGNAISSVTITPATTDPNATVTVNGATLASGATSAAIALNVGNNTIITTVTAQDGSTIQSYTIIVNRQQLESLASLTTSTGTLTPTFDPATFSYNILVSNATLTISVKPVATDVKATLTINGTPIASGAKSAPISLSVGSNTITTVVTSQNGATTQAYTLTVIRQALSSNAGLANLALSNGSLSPGFATGVNSYSVNVVNDVASIKLTPTTSDPTATVTVNGTPVKSGSASSSQVLYVGNNTITIVVTAKDGVTRNSYKVSATRAASSNANLTSLAINNVKISPVFAQGTTSYTASVGSDMSSVTVTSIISDPNATATVNGVALSSGVTSAPIPLKVGVNAITTVVTAQDGTTIRSYTIAVTRVPSSNANLSNIVLNRGSLGPVFATKTTTYTALVSYSTTSVTLTPTVSNTTATVTVNGVPVASGSASVSQPLIVGNNIITTVVTAQDGITKDTYKVKVVRATNNLDISLLLLSSHTPLTLESGNGDLNYTTTVGKSVGSLTIAPTTTNVTLKVNGSPVPSGSASKPITLNDGPTAISLLVASKDGTDSKTYKLTVKRPIALTNANLSGLKISSGTLSPAFDPAIFNYTVSVDSAISTFAITPVISDTNATLTVNNKILASGSLSAPVALNQGDNTITIVVTAADGKTTQLYTVTVNKQKTVILANADMQDAVAKIIVHQAVSPNGDGINDFLLIEGIENYPGNKVSIVNRNGVTIYSVNEYNNSSKAFDGHSNINGRLQQPGTYFYIVEYTVNGEARRKTGYFILKF